MRRSLLVLLVLFVASSALAGGFQVTAQGARAMGMGLAWTAVADDASAIYYNPAGLAFFNHDFILGGMGATTVDGTFQRTGSSLVEDQRDGITGLPQIYGAGNVFGVKAGVGLYAPFGLPIRWENPTTFSGRFVAHTAILRAIDLNPTVAFHIGPNFAIGVGADYMASKVQLERFVPLSPTLSPVSSAKISSDIADSRGWGWNAGVLWKGTHLRLGAAYRSPIDIDHEARIGFNPAVGTTLPADAPAAVHIDFPASLNLGVAYQIGNTTVAADLDRTQWSSFDRLDVFVGSATTPLIHRPSNWDDSQAWRVGVETSCFGLKCRAGYYQDQTPQPQADVGPVLADADRQGFTVGLGFNLGPHVSVDVADIYVKFDSRASLPNPTEPLAPVGVYDTTGNELAVNFHVH